jgi:hypothetical protein
LNGENEKEISSQRSIIALRLVSITNSLLAF